MTAGHDVTCGNCHTILRELSTKPPHRPSRAQSHNERQQQPSLFHAANAQSHCFSLYHAREKRHTSQAAPSDTNMHARAPEDYQAMRGWREHRKEPRTTEGCPNGRGIEDKTDGMLEGFMKGSLMRGNYWWTIETGRWGNGGMIESKRGIEQNDGVKEDRLKV